jgi:hypothetical protein
MQKNPTAHTPCALSFSFFAGGGRKNSGQIGKTLLILQTE